MKIIQRHIAIFLSFIMLAGLIPGGLLAPISALAAPPVDIGNTVISVDGGGALSTHHITQNINAITANASGIRTITSDGVYLVNDTATGIIAVAANVNAVIVLDGASRESATGAGANATSPLQIAAGANVILVLMDGTTNTFTCKGTNSNPETRQAGINVLWDSTSSATLTIREGYLSGESRGTQGELNVTGGDFSAGIGGGPNQNCGIVKIEGGKITATSGGYASATTGHGNGAGIGGGGGNSGGGGSCELIEIYGTANVTATSKNDGAGIGGAGGGPNPYLDRNVTGGGGDGGTIRIHGDAVVVALSEADGAGIGGGGRSSHTNGLTGGSGGDVEIYGNAVVTATSAENGAGIGGGGSRNDNANSGAGNGGNLVIHGNPIVVAHGGANDIGAGAHLATGTKGADGTITITSGNVHAVNTSAVTNGAANGDTPLAMAWVDSANASIDTIVVPRSLPATGSYDYDAPTNTSGRAWVWLPLGEPSATFSELGLDTKIYNTTSRVYITAEAEHTHLLGTVVSIEWFRVPVKDNALYNTDLLYEAKLTTKSPENRGSEAAPPDSRDHTFSIPADKNANYWVRVKFQNYDAVYYEYYNVTVDNFYTPIEIFMRDTGTPNNPSEVIRPYEELINPSGAYGLPLDLDGTILDSAPSLNFDTVQYSHNSTRPLSHWELTLPALTTTSSPLISVITLDDEIAKTPPEDGIAESSALKRFYTAKYSRNENWCELTVQFVDQDGNFFDVGSGDTSDTVWIPLDDPGFTTSNNFKSLGGAYTPPSASGAFEARGWYIATSSHAVDPTLSMSNPGTYFSQDQFSDFDPALGTITVSGAGTSKTGTLSGSRTLYIVYAAPAVRLYENHYEYDGSLPDGRTTTIAAPQSDTVIETTTTSYSKQSLTNVTGKVCVGFEVIADDSSVIVPFTKFEFDWSDSSNTPDKSQLGEVVAEITAAQLSAAGQTDLYHAKPIVNFYYEEAVSGIPVSEAAFLTLSWHGEVVIANSSFHFLAANDVKIATRINRPITKTNDGTPTGDADHILNGIAPTQWLFDDDKPGNLISYTKTPSTAGEEIPIIFYYGYSSNGSFMDKHQFVTEKYMLADGTSIPSAPDIPTPCLVNTLYTKSAPEISGYTAVGTVRGVYDGGGTYDSSTSFSFTRAATPASETVTFIYKEAATITVLHQGTTEGSAIVNFTPEYKNGYDGQTVTLLPLSLPGWELDSVDIGGAPLLESSTPGEYEVTLDKNSPQTVTFHYNETRSYTTTTITGVRPDSSTIYTFTLRVNKADWSASHTISSSLLPVLTPSWALVPGQDSKLTIDTRENQNITLNYMSGYTPVTVYAKLFDTNADIITPITFPQWLTGQTFTYQSPSVAGYTLTDNLGNTIAPYLDTIPTVNPVNNSITFYYKVSSGQQLVIYQDDDGNELGRDMIELVVGNPTPIPLITIEHYTSSSTEETVNWDGSLKPDGSADLPAIVYTYTRNTSTLTLKAFDTTTGAPILDSSSNEVTITIPDLSVLSLYDFEDDIPDLEAKIALDAATAHYILAAQPLVISYISATATDNVAQVWFTPLQNGFVPVEVRVIRDGATYVATDSSTYTLLQSFSEPAATGEAITFASIRIPNLTSLGYENETAENVLTATEGVSGSKIILVYRDDRFKTTISNNLDYVVITEKTPIGETIRLSPPYKDGAVVIAYTLGTDPTQHPIGDLPLGYHEVATATDIKFIYQTYVNITITGKDASSNTLYTFTKRVVKSDTAISIAADLPNLAPTWVLPSSESAKLNPVPNADKAITLNYISGMTTVTINAVFDDGTYTTPIPGFVSYVVPSVVGTSFTFGVPTISGYVNSGTSGNPFTPTETAATNVVTFYYKKASGNVTVTAMDEQSNIIGQHTATAAPGESTDVASFDFLPTASNIPALSHHTLDPSGAHTTTSLTYDGVTDVSIVYYFTRNTEPLTLVAKDTVTGNTIQVSGTDVEHVISDLRVLEHYNYSGNISSLTAQVPTGYTLVSPGSTNFYVTDTPSNNVVTVWYTPTASGVVPVEIRIEKGTYNSSDPSTYEVFQTYTLPAATDETITLSGTQIPNLTALGYTFSAAQSSGTMSATEGVPGSKIVLIYTDDRVEVTVSTKLGSSPASQVSVEKLVSGGSVTLYPPFVAGHTATSHTIDGTPSGSVPSTGVTLTSVSADTAVVFIYEPSGVTPTDGKLTVIVSIAASGALQAGATVEISNGGTPIPGSPFTTDISGAVEIDPADFDTYDIEVSYTDYDMVSTSVTLNASNAVQVVNVALGKNTGSSGGGGSGSGGVNAAKLIIKCVDEQGNVIYLQELSTIVGRAESISAPPIDGFTLASGEASVKAITIRSGTNEVIFNYIATKPDSPARFPVSEGVMELLETQEHIVYIQGYPDGTIRPDGSITRAEIATIFWRLLKNSAKNDPIDSAFSDVSGNEWFAQAVNYLASIGVITGYEDGTFRPSQRITRAEFSAIVSRFDDLIVGISNPFVDISDSHWASEYIISSYSKGWISGYPGNVFLPDNDITRAEVVKVVNCMLGRGIKKADIPAEAYGIYSDLPSSHWAFAEMIEASFQHNYTRLSDGYEIYVN